jgi:hypothetical protein
MISKRNFLWGLVSAPAVIVTPGLLMPVKAWIEPAGKWYMEVTGPFLPPLDRWGADINFVEGDTFSVEHAEGYSVRWTCVGSGVMHEAEFSRPSILVSEPVDIDKRSITFTRHTLV